MSGLELICFQIISNAGGARSSFIEAIQYAKIGEIEEAERAIKDGETSFLEGHQVHAKLIQAEANNESIYLNLLLIHAEDQLMSAEAFKILVYEFIDIYKILFETR